MSELKFGIELPQHLAFPYLKELVLAAERLGLEYVRRFAGYGELETFLHENVPAESD